MISRTKAGALTILFLTALCASLVAGSSASAAPQSRPAFWICPDGVQDTLENQQAGICVEYRQPTPTPKPKYYPKPSATPVPPPTTVVTAPPATPTTPPPVAVPPPPPGEPQRMGEVCDYEPTTGMWEIRTVPNGNQRVEEHGDEWPIAPGVCDQHPEPVPTPRPVQQTTATPAPVKIVEILPTPSTPPPAPRFAPLPCVYSPDLVAIIDDDGQHLFDPITGLPVWLDTDGRVVVGVLCPVEPVRPEPPFPAPNLGGDGSAAEEVVE